MPVTKIVTSIVPNPTVLHYFQTPEALELSKMITRLSRVYKTKILSYEKFKDQTTVISRTTYESRAISDEFDSHLFDQFPNYRTERDAYNAANGIVWNIEYEES